MRNQKSPFHVHKIGEKRETEQPKRKNGKVRLAGKYFLLLVGTVLLTLVVYFGEKTGSWFKASVLEAPEPFNGTVMPVEKVPDWVRFKGDHITTHYLSIPADQLIPLPAYDLSVLQFPEDRLKWGDPQYDNVYNTKLTYPVVYLGNYKNTHEEHVGSHLAIDIKMPQGTPVRAIANGKVVKMIMEESGFGHHLVIKHIGVPDPDMPDRLTTLYSAYNHMADIRVAEGQNVRKGDIVGTSGNTGTSTTPHLHFQIDRDSAPWHPYWPFTWKESQDAGMSFFEAVNAGLGLRNAEEKTVNPMAFIEKHLNDSLVASSGGGNVVPQPGTGETGETETATPETELPPASKPPTQESPVTPVTEPTAPIVEIPTEERTDTSLFSFKLIAETVSLKGNGVPVTVVDENGQIAKLQEGETIDVRVAGVGAPLRGSLSKEDFEGNQARIIVRSQETGESLVLIGKSSVRINFIDAVQTASTLAFEHDGFFQKNVAETVTVLATDENGQPTPAVNFSGEIEVTVEEGQAMVTPKNLRLADFKNGIATVRIKAPNEKPVVLRAQNGALVGESAPLQPETRTLFTDIGPEHPNAAAIRFLKDENVIGGYPDGSFRPENTVNRVEALKMLMLAFGVQTGVSGPLSFKDTEQGAWYAGIVAAAVERGIVKGYDDGRFRPSQTVNRAEYLKILFNAAGVAFEGALIAKPYEDVERADWFAPFAVMANRKNLLDAPDNRLRPGDGMTRADVAETIYRMKMIEKEGLTSYVK